MNRAVKNFLYALSDVLRLRAGYTDVEDDSHKLGVVAVVIVVWFL